MTAVREFDNAASGDHRPAATHHDAEAIAALLTGARVLVVEDQKSQREFIAKMLSELHIEVDTAGGGATAMAILRTAAFNGMPYHLVMTDLHMPGGDGYQLLKAIRMDTGIRTMPVVVLSADSDEEVILRCASLGISSYIQKPASKAELRRVISNALACSATYVREREGGASGDGGGSGLRITRPALEDFREVILRIANPGPEDEEVADDPSDRASRLVDVVLQWVDRHLGSEGGAESASADDDDPDGIAAGVDDDEDDPDAQLAA